jgi:hypothetical protein
LVLIYLKGRRLSAAERDALILKEVQPKRRSDLKPYWSQSSSGKEDHAEGDGFDDHEDDGTEDDEDEWGLSASYGENSEGGEKGGLFPVFRRTESDIIGTRKPRNGLVLRIVSA